MRKKFAITLLTAVGAFLFLTANSNAGVHFGIFLGGPPEYCPPPVYCPPPAYGYYGYPAYGYGERYHRHYHRDYREDYRGRDRWDR